MTLGQPGCTATQQSCLRFDAAADLRTLARLIPARSRLVLEAPSQQQGPAVDYEPDSVSVPTSSVRAGDLLRILPGERIPVDGEVLQGRCSVDESMLTGESVLVAKQAGAQVRCLPSAAHGGCGRAHAACASRCRCLQQALAQRAAHLASPTNWDPTRMSCPPSPPPPALTICSL